MKYYPTKQHERASEKLVEIFSKDKRVMSIILYGSCVRGKAEKGSCLDFCLLVKDKKQIEPVVNKFKSIYPKVKEFNGLKALEKYSHIDLFVSDGKIKITKRDWTSGPDEYELSIGNLFVYSAVLFDRNNYFKNLKKKHLPYYSEKIRKERLIEVKKYLFNNLDHVPLYVKRKLYFQAFSRLYNASKEFLQAIFIKRKIYPISYDKWIKEQMVEILEEPGLYKNFVNLLEIKKLESNELIGKYRKLKRMAEEYL